ncbi:MAG TPA: transposase [Burkholderiales bacterium]
MHASALKSADRLRRHVEENVIERFLECGDPHHGFARIYCDRCRHTCILAFSCKARYFCPSCHQKRVLAYGEWVEANVLAPVPHWQYVFTVPRLLRLMFFRRRALLGKLCAIVERLLAQAYASARPGARPGMILFVQTFGDLVNFNPHIHVLAADGVFAAEGGFTVLPPVPRKVLEPWFRAEVLALLRREGLITDLLAQRMLGWRHTGFSAHNAVRIRARDVEGRRRLAQYMLRAPFALEKMSYDPRSGTVIYRSRMHKTLKRNFQIMPGADWLAQLCAHIPDRFEHLVRYAGWYSNRSRGKRRRAGGEPTEVVPKRADLHDARRARSTWVRLIHKVYEVDPLQCPRCKGPMRVIALIDDAAIIRKILRHVGLWAPQQSRRSQIGPPARDPPTQSMPVLTYHPVPDIA